MIIGAAYYPEHWEKARWAQDIALMKDMGLNAVRMGEFGWSVIEKEEGNYDFSLYDEVIELLAESGISTIMGTPTAAPPAWICDKYPDIFMEDQTGQKRGFGSRRHYCYNHSGYQTASERIVSAMARHFSDNPHVIAWQVDNELGCEDEVRCYCKDCRNAFIGWLQNKYQTLESLNENWGTVFWSQTYTRWEQIGLPVRTVVDGYTGYGHNPGFLLDFSRFSSDSLINFAGKQCELIRRFTDKPVVHNVVSEFCDNYKLSALMDRVGYDAYPQSEWDCNSPGKIGFQYDLTRGFRDAPLWILEQQSGPCGWNIIGRTPEEGELKLWSLQGAARGVEALIYFRWRTCLSGTEQFWYGILDHDGIPGRRYKELKEAVHDIIKYDDILSLPNQRQALLIYDYDNKFSHEFQPHVKGFVYKDEVIRYYEALMNLHLSTDVGGLQSQLDGYELVILPFCSMLETSDFIRIEEYVRNGGTLVLTPFTGQRLKNNQIMPLTLPGLWREMAGISIREFYTLPHEVRPPEGHKLSGCPAGYTLPHEVRPPEGHSLQENCVGTSEFGDIRLWREKISMETAECMADCLIDGDTEPIITKNIWGDGSVYYIAALFENYEVILNEICKSMIAADIYIPEEVECIVKEGKEHIILLNHCREEKNICLKGYYEMECGGAVTSIPGFSWMVAERKL